MSRFLTTPILYGLLAALLAAVLVAGWQTYQLSQERSAHKSTKLEHAKVLAGLAEATRKALEEARAREREHTEAMARIGATHQEELTRVQTEHDGLVRDLRTGIVRLQDRWAGCPAAPGVPAAGTPGPGADAAADDRAASAARIVRAAAECDAQVKGLQSIIRADRQ
jgi:replicative DNA helicase